MAYGRILEVQRNKRIDRPKIDGTLTSLMIGGREVATEVGLENLRQGLREQGRILARRPEAIAHARTQAAGAAPPLIGRRAGYPNGDQAGHPGPDRIPGNSRESGIDDDPNAFDREAGLRN